MKLPYQRWESDLWLGSKACRVLSFEEQGAYRLLLDVAWSHGPAKDAETPPTLPTDPSELAFEIACPEETFLRLWKKLSRFFEQREDRLINPTQYEKWESCLGICRSRSKAASVAAEARWSDASGMRDAKAEMRDACVRMPIDIKKEIKSNTEKKTEEKTPSIVSPNGFDAFWASYPRKTAKAAAQKAWKSLKPSDDLKAKILKALEQQKTWQQWREARFVPHPATWINGRRWEDEAPRGTSRMDAARAQIERLSG